MKRILILLIINLLFLHFLFAQDNSRISTFFNDTLKGKWLLQKSCYKSFCDTVGKNTEYVIFTSITPQGFVKFSTNGSWCTSKGDSAKLFLHFSNSWKIDDFLFFDFEKTEIGIQFENFDKLFLITIDGGGASKEYNRDKSFSDFQNVKSEPIKIFPNPFVDKFTLSCDMPNPTNRVSLVIYSTTGALLKKIEIPENGQSTKIISLEDLNKGIYLGVLTLDNKEVKNIKLIKE